MIGKNKPTTLVGSQAENAVAQFLISKGHKIIAQNWRTRWCEIDIISQLKNTIYFTEVKYRKKDNWGGGFEAITPMKLKQMNFAAEMWISSNNWDGEVALAAASVSGNDFLVDDFIEIT